VREPDQRAGLLFIAALGDLGDFGVF